MNPIESKKLIKLINSLDTSRPIEPQLDANYTLWRGAVVPKFSWKGRIVTFFTGPTQTSTLKQKVYGRFAEAITLEQEAIPTSEICNFWERTIRHKRYEPDLTVPGELSETPEIDKLIEEELRLKRENRERYFGGSLFRINRNSSALTVETLEELINNQNLTEGHLNTFETYLQRHPEIAEEEWESRLNLIRENLEEEKNDEDFLGNTSPEGRHTYLLFKADQLRQKVLSLESGSRGTVLYSHHFGHRSSIFKKLLLQCTQVDYFKKLPLDIQRSFLKGLGPLLQNLIEKLLNYSAEHNNISLDDDLTNTLKSIFSQEVFFPDATRNASETAQSILPDVILDALESKMREGGLLTISKLMDVPFVTLVLDWLLKNGSTLAKVPESEQARKWLAERIVSLIAHFEAKHRGKFDYYSELLFNNIVKWIPPVLFKMLEIEDLFEKGQIWLEFSRQSDEMFGVSIYTMGKGQDYHPDSRVCLKLIDIPVENLDENFFENLLKHNWESLWNEDARPLVSNFYEGEHSPLHCLQGVLDEAYAAPKDKERLSSTFELAFHSILKPEMCVSEQIFQCKFELFVDYCRTHMLKNGVFKLEKHHYPFVQASYDKLFSEFQQLKEKPASIEATFHEINDELIEFSRHQKAVNGMSNLDLGTVNLLRNTLPIFGITDEFILKIDSLIRECTGEASGPYLDAITNMLLEIAPKKTNKTPEVQTSKPPVVNYSSVYLNLAWNISLVTLMVVSITSGGVWALFSIPTLLLLLPQLLPEKQYEIYLDILEAIRFTAAKFIFKAIWNSSLNNETKENLAKIAANLPERISNLVTKDDFPKVQFELMTEAPANIENPEVDEWNLQEPLCEKINIFAHKRQFELSNIERRDLIDIKRMNLWIKGVGVKLKLPDLINSVMNLPMPGLNSPWTKLKDGDKTIADLYSLSHTLMLTWCNTPGRMVMTPSGWEQKRRTSDILVPVLYKIQAIIYEIIQTCPSEIVHPLQQGFKPDSLPLIEWYLNHDTVINTPELLEMVEFLIRFFNPHFNLDQPPSKEDLLKSESMILWPGRLIMDRQIASLDAQKQRLDYLDEHPTDILPEEVYFQEILEKNRESLKNFTEPEILFLLHADSLDENRKDCFIPLRYIYLKNLSYLCGKFAIADSDLTILDKKLSVVDTIGESSTDSKEILIQKREIFLLETIHLYNFHFRNEKVIKKAPPMDQMQIAAFSKGKMTEKLKRKLVRAEATETIIQAIDLCREDPETYILSNEFKRAIFKSGELRNALKQAPETVSALAHVVVLALEKNFETHRIHRVASILELANQLDHYCRAYVPESKDKFVFIDTWISKLKFKRHVSTLAKTLLSLELSRLPEFEKSTAHPDLLINISRIIVTRHIFYPRLSITNLERSWYQAVAEFCKDEINRKNILRAIFKDLAYSKDNLNSILHEGVLNLAILGTEEDHPLLNFGLDVSDELLGLPNTLYEQLHRRYIGNEKEFNSLQLVDRFTLQNRNGTEIYRIIPEKIEPLGSKDDVRFFYRVELIKSVRKHGRVAFTSVTLADKPLNQMVESKLGVSTPKDVRGWIAQPISTLLLRSNRSKSEIVLEGTLTELGHLTYLQSEVQKKPDEYVRVAHTQTFRDRLKPILNFCPIADIEFYRKSTSAEISHFRFKPQNLGFTIRPNQEGVLTAYSDEFEGYFIAPSQYHPKTAKLIGGLLLQTATGKTRFLLPAGYDLDRWCLMVFLQSILTIILPPKFFKKLLDNVDFNHPLTSPEYYVCDIEEKDGSYEIISADDKALGVLMLIHLIAMDEVQVEKVLNKMIWIYHSRPVPADYWPEMKYFLMPIHFPNLFSHEVRWKLLAARELNHWIFHSPRSTPSTDEDFYVAKANTLLVVLDLTLCIQYPEIRNMMSIVEEYFLYQHLLFQLTELIGSTLPKDSALHSILNMELLEKMLQFPPFSQTQLTRRYFQIKSQLGIPMHQTGAVLDTAFSLAFSTIEIPEIRFKKNQYVPPSNTKKNLFFETISSLKKIKEVHSATDSSIDFDCELLHKEMNPHLRIGLNLKKETFIPELVKLNFLSYYGLMRGDKKFQYLEGDELKNVNKEKLKELLEKQSGLGDKTCQRLTKILLFVGSYPTSYPSTDELMEAFEIKGFSIHAPQYDKWRAFLSILWNLVNIQELSETVLMPIIGKSVLLQVAKGPIDGLATSMSQNSEGLASIAIGTAREQTNHLLSKAYSAHSNQFVSVLSGPSGTQSLKSLGIKTALLGAGAALSYVALNRGGAYLGQTVMETVGKTVSPSFAIPKAVVAAAPIVLNVGFNAAKSIQKTGKVGVGDVMPFWASRGLNMAYKATALAVDTALQPLPQEPMPIEINLTPSVLKEEDEAIDRELDRIFDIGFEETVGFDEDRIPLIQIDPHLSPIEKAQKEKINRSIVAYYNNPDRIPSRFQCRDKNVIGRQYIELKVLAIKLETRIAHEISQLESILFTPYKIFNKWLDKPDVQFFHANQRLTREQVPIFKLAITRINMKKSRLKQIQRLLGRSKKTLRYLNENKQEKLHHELETLAIGLKTKTTIDLDFSNKRLTHLALQFEAVTGDKLWSMQSIKLQQTVEGNIILEIKPGAGKTRTIGPATAAEISDGKRLAILIYPKQLAGDNMKTTNFQMKNVFGKNTYVLPFNRDSELDPRALETQLALWNGAKAGGEVIQMTKEDAQALASLFFEQLFNYQGQYESLPKRYLKLIKGLFSRQLKGPEETAQTLKLLHKLLNILFHSVAIADEAHETFAHRKQLNYPLGPSVTIHGTYVQIMETVMREVSRCKQLFESLKLNKGYCVDEADYHNVSKKEIAKALSQLKSMNIEEEHRAEFIAFVCEELKYVPDWMKANKKLKSKVCLIKGVLNDLLPMNFRNRATVDYGKRADDTFEFSRPSDGNMGASIRDTIKLPEETYIKTVLMLFVEGLSKEQFSKLVEKFRSIANSEMTKTGILYKETKVCTRFGKYLTEKLMFQNDEDDFEIAFNALRLNADICLRYTHHFIAKQIIYWKLNIESNSHMFANLISKMISFSGTPFNESTYPTWLKMVSEESTIGELLHMVNQRCPPDGIHVIDTSEPRANLDRILQQFFGPDSTFSALIDGGALFAGMTNLEVASKMLDHCEDRPEIEAIAFYQENESKQEELHYLLKGSQKPISASKIKIKPKNRLTYYDQRHGFGADVDQIGDGLETIGPYQPLQKWLQEICRIRGLIKPQRLEAWEGLELKKQKIHFVMTQEVQRLVMKHKEGHPALADIVDYAILNLIDIIEKEIFPSLISKIKNVPVKAIYQKILSIPSDHIEEWSKLFYSFIDLFITKVEDDPAIIFGLKKRTENIIEVLHQAAETAMAPIRKSTLLSREEKAAIQEDMNKLLSPLNLPPLPREVTIAKSMNKSLAHLGLQQTAEVTATQTAEMNVNQQEEEQQQQEQSQEVDSQLRTNLKFNFKEWAWPEITDPTSLSLIKVENDCSLTWQKNPFSKQPCPLYSLVGLIEASSDAKIRAIHPSFDRRIWVSNNFLPRAINGLLGGITQTPIEIGSPFQAQLTETLVHFKIIDGVVKIISVGALSMRDASLWRSKLPTDPLYWDDKEIKVVLWHANLGSIQAGNPRYQQLLETNEDLSTLMLQLKLIDGQTNLKSDKAALKQWLKTGTSFMEGLETLITTRGKTFKGSYLNKILLKKDRGHHIEDEL